MNVTHARKESGVAWLGAVPAHWQVNYLGNVVDVVGGSTPSKENLAFWDGTIPWISPKDMKRDVIYDSEDHVTEQAVVRTSLRLLPPPAVLMVIRGMILDHTVPVAITAAPVTVNQDVKALRPRAGVAPDFLAHFLRAMNGPLLARVEEAGHGTKALRTDLWRKLPVLLPPFDEQRAIATFLDRKTAAIDTLIAKKQRLIEVLQEKRQALITQAVTRGLDATVPMKDSGIQWIGQIPAHWMTLPIKRTARRQRKAFTDGDWIETPYITEQGVRLIQTGNVGIGRYREQGYRYVSESTFNELNCTEVTPGDVLICRLDGPVGRACLAPSMGTRMITSVDNAILKPSSECDGRYLVYVLSSPKYLDWVQVLCRVGGGFRFRVSRSMLGDIKIPVPPVSEQLEIAGYLDDITQRHQLLEAKLEQHCEKLREYRQGLITAAVTGKIDVTREAA
jgi:type I restriction enzyme S subunit